MVILTLERMIEMKYIILSLVISLGVVLSGCANNIEPNTKDFDESITDSSTTSENKENKSDDYSQNNTATNNTTTQTPSVSSAKSSSASAEPLMAGKSVDLSTLDNTLIGYGQGVIVDSKNRPQGAIDFNEKYSKYNAIAMAKTDNSKKSKEKTIYLTFDQGYEIPAGYYLLTPREKEGKSYVLYIEGLRREKSRACKKNDKRRSYGRKPFSISFVYAEYID